MFNVRVAKARRVFAVVHFGMLILRWCGLRIFVEKLAHQLYGRTVFIVEENPLERLNPASSFKCIVSPATPDDVEELYRGLPHESREGRYQLLVRKYYHERGFGDCYIARATDTNEICHVRWLVMPKHIRQLGWEDGYPLAEDQLMWENSYTLEKYRRQGVRTACIPQLREISRGLGFTRTRGYVDETNIPQLTADQKDGDMVYARVLERHILFRVIRKTLERYDPPIPITISQVK